MLQNLDGLVWLLVSVWPLLYFQRMLHRNIQAVFLLITRRAEVSLALFSMLFFPGVFLHESSHYLVARLLGVRTGRFSLLPQPMPDGRLQLGFVETEKVDILRDALIGAAPLLFGGALVAYMGLIRLGMDTVWDGLVAGTAAAILSAIDGVLDKPDFWLWFYLTFTISSTMLPSPSDRRAWLPLGMVISGLLVVTVIAGAGPWMIENLAAPLNSGLRALAVILGISVIIHVIVLLPVYLLVRLLSRMTGYQVV